MLRGLSATGDGQRGPRSEEHRARGILCVWCVCMWGAVGSVIGWVFGFSNGFIAGCGFDFAYELSVEGCCNFEEHKI